MTRASRLHAEMAEPIAAVSTGVTGSIPPFIQVTLAVIAGGAVANIYYNQPMLGLIAKAFGPAAPTAVAAATLLGYGAGIFLLAPLGDRWQRRTLIVGQQVILAGTLALAAAAPDLKTLTAASAAIGFFATSSHHAVPLTAELAPAEARGRMVGRTMTGVLLGILLARTMSGTIATQQGWRVVFAAAAGLALILAMLAVVTLPRTRPSAEVGYRTLMTSMLSFVREEAALRSATLTQGCVFATFNTFWASLSLHLADPAFGLGPTSAGLFGLLGAAGALVAPIAGRLADRHGPLVVLGGGAAITLASFAVFATFGRSSLIGLGAGVLVLDVGATAAMIANQARIYALRPEARGRLNTVYSTGIFLAGAVGASAGTWSYALGGWPAVCGLGALFAAGALAGTLRWVARGAATLGAGRRRPAPSDGP